jgi:hypothetical protein
MTKSRDLANAATALNAVTATELGFVDGVTSAIQTQIDTKLATATAATTYVANSLADAKGDLLTATADNTPARLAVGSNGDTLVADSSTSTGLRYKEDYAAGKNAIINGAFNVWQRGTSFVNVLTGPAYTADRWNAYSDANNTVSRQTFTPGTAPVAGYEGQFFLRLDKSAGGVFSNVSQRIEDVRTFAGQTITVSFWAKASATISLAGGYEQNFGSGGSAAVNSFVITPTLTTSWARYSATIAIPSISGKTIGTSSYLEIFIGRAITSSAIVLDFWGVQVEESSVATAFQTATGTIQGELAACQYYTKRITASASGDSMFGVGVTDSTVSSKWHNISFPTMRTAPSLTALSKGAVFSYTNGWAVGTLTLTTATTTNVTLAASGMSSFTAGQTAWLGGNSGTAFDILLVSEL